MNLKASDYCETIFYVLCYFSYFDMTMEQREDIITLFSWMFVAGYHAGLKKDSDVVKKIKEIFEED